MATTVAGGPQTTLERVDTGGGIRETQPKPAIRVRALIQRHDIPTPAVSRKPTWAGLVNLRFPVGSFEAPAEPVIGRGVVFMPVGDALRLTWG